MCMYHGKSCECFLGENVTSTSTHEFELGGLLESSPKVERVSGTVVLQQVSEVLHDHVGVVIRLEEPVRLLQVVPVDVLEGGPGLGPQVVPALPHAELGGGQGGVQGGAHEQQSVAPPAPRGLHVLGLDRTE